MPDMNLAFCVTENDSLFYMVGQQVTSFDSKISLCKLNLKGDTIKTNVYQVDSLYFIPSVLKLIENELIVFGTVQQVDSTHTVSQSDIFISSFDLNLNINWIKTYGGSAHESGKDFKFTKDKGIIMTGKIITPTKSQILLTKIDSLGNIEWEQKYGESSALLHTIQSEAESVSLSTDNSYLICGYTRNIVLDRIDAYYLKIDSMGQVIWEKHLETDYGSYSSCLTQINDTTSILLGTKRSNNSSLTDRNGFFSLIDIRNGDEILSKDYYFKSRTSFYDNFIVKNKKIVFVGHEMDNDNFSNIFLICLDFDGNLIWKRDYYNYNNKDKRILNVSSTNDSGYIFCGYHIDTSNIYRSWIIKTDCFGYDSVTYYFKDSICILEDCYRYQEDATFTVSSDILDLNSGAQLEVKNVNATNAQLTWSFGDGIQIENQVSYKHTYQNPGSYEVQLLFEKGICSLSTKRTIVVLKPTVFNNFALYPNPNQGQFMLKHYFDGGVNLFIYDALGQVIYWKDNIDSSENLQPALASGIYIVSLEVDDKIYQQKMVVNN
jgi:PKD repeat protein